MSVSSSASAVAESSLSSVTNTLRRSWSTGVLPAPLWAAAASTGSASGSRTRNVLPFPGPWLSALMVPPCSSTSCRTSASPMPSPPTRCPGSPPTWVNISNIRGRSSLAIPIPVSATRTRAWPAWALTSIRICPPGCMYLVLLVRILTNTCASRIRSAKTCMAAAAGFTISW